MTLNEIMEILAMLKVAYPQQLNKITEIETKAMANLWRQTFARLPKEIMGLAVAEIVKTAKFFPSIAEMVEVLEKLNRDARNKLSYYGKYTIVDSVHCFDDDYVAETMRNYDEDTERKLQFIAENTMEFSNDRWRNTHDYLLTAIENKEQFLIKGEKNENN